MPIYRSSPPSGWMVFSDLIIAELLMARITGLIDLVAERLDRGHILLLRGLSHLEGGRLHGFRKSHELRLPSKIFDVRGQVRDLGDEKRMPLHLLERRPGRIVRF